MMILKLFHRFVQSVSNLLPPSRDFPYKILQYCGFWLPDNCSSTSTLVYRFYTRVIQFIEISVYIGQVLYLIKQNNIEEVVLSSALSIPALGSVCRQFSFLLNKKQLSDIENEIRSHKYFEKDKRAIEIKNYYYGRLRFMTISIAITITLFGIVHTTTSWISNHYAMPVWIPDEIMAVTPYWIRFIYTLIPCWVHIMVIMSYDLILSGHLIQIAMHLEILKYHLFIIPPLNESKRKKYLVNCIQYQQYIYKLSHDIQNIFLVSNTVVISSVCLSLCVGIFKFSVDNLYSVNSWVSVQFILAIVVKWAIQCWEATIVMHKSMEIGRAAYNLNWIDFDKSVAKDVMIIINRSTTRPIIFTGVLSVSLSNDTFRTVMKTSYNVYILLKHITNVSEKQQLYIE